MTRRRVTLAVDDDHLERFEDVARKAKEAGLDLDEELPEIGVITGSIDDDKLRDLEQVEGIQAVEGERRIRIPPPESDVQ